jgi:transcriptional regulator with XRE-family HTH domain
MNEVQALQTAFFNKIKQQANSITLVANEIAELLSVTKSEVYHKMQGRSFLTLQQIYLLSKTYNVPFFTGGNNKEATTVFQYQSFYEKNITIDNYLSSLHNFLSGISAGKNKKLFCATEDVPTFHLFKYPELAAFKMYYWERRLNALNSDTITPPFNSKSIRPDRIKTAHELYLLHREIPGVEIWSRGALFNTIDQINYAAETGNIKDKCLGRTIAQQFLSVLQDVERDAKQQKKDGSNVPFDWYFCDVIGNITYLAEMNGSRMAFIRLNTFNNLHTDEERICNEIRLWIDALINDGVSFSGQSSKYRNLYLNEAFKGCHNLIGAFS